jgi:hypothetical protein
LFLIGHFGGNCSSFLVFFFPSVARNISRNTSGYDQLFLWNECWGLSLDRVDGWNVVMRRAFSGGNFFAFAVTLTANPCRLFNKWARSFFFPPILFHEKISTLIEGVGVVFLCKLFAPYLFFRAFEEPDQIYKYFYFFFLKSMKKWNQL